jgi:hypothetical protein
MILEGVVTTLDAAGALNVAPMGPIVDDAITRLTLRPFQTSQTYRNLKAHGCGVFHVTDDVLLIAQAALNRLPELPATFPAERIAGRVLADCCRWFEFRVVTLDDAQERTRIEAEVVHTGRRRDFFGFNRAKHAVLEATILATRLHLISAEEVRAELARLRLPVDKTAGPSEREAWDLVANYVDAWFARQS